VTKAGTPVGVLVVDRFFFFGPAAGDYLRKVDGKAVKTVEQAVAALEAAVAKPKLVLDLERAGLAYTATFILEDTPVAPPPDPEIDALIDKIEKVNDTSYKIPKKLADKLVANPTAFTRGARVVPAMKNGKPDGMKLYAIRPNSIFAKVGLTNGDTVKSVNRMPIDSAEHALKAYEKVRTASKITLEIVRRGNPVTIEWQIK
jgi:S1-C subfamily serine protease